MSVNKISEAILGVGVDDTTIDLFESQYPVPTGVSYNSYVLLSDRHVRSLPVQNPSHENHTYASHSPCKTVSSGRLM